MYICKECGKEYSRLDFYERHIKTHEENIEEKLEVVNIEEIIKDIESKPDFNEIKARAFKRQFGKFKCVECGKISLTYKAHQKHKCR